MNWRFWKKICANNSMEDDKQVSLTPALLNRDSESDKKQYRSVLNLARKLEEKDILNIALTGPYGSGKSSILRSLKKDYPKYKYLSISLATLKSPLDDKKNEIDIDTMNNRIEYSILQQLIYKEKQETLYNSRLKRIYHKSTLAQYALSFAIIFYAVALIIVFEPSFLKVEWICNRLSNPVLNKWSDIFALSYIFIATIIFAQKTIKSLSNSKLNKLNLKNGEIELKENKEDTSVFNKHMDEIVYFFEVTNYNVVIIEDLDRAIELMSLTTDNGKNRLTKNVALLFKSRVALFEATWLKYHKGTDRVPGGPGWPGAQQEYNAGFSIDIDKEVDWFLEQAMDASAQVADRISLTKNTGIYNPDSNPYNWNPYFEMFSAVDMEPIDEVLFWRAYSSVQGVTHSVSSYLCKGGGDLGYTRSLVDACLMKNGLPIYAPNSGYAGDVTIENVKKDRDDRLQLFMGAPSDCSRLDPYETYKYPKILEQTNDRCPTGYTVRKFLTYDPAQVVIGSGAVNTYGCLLFRSVEANLNYIEACYEKNGSLDPKAIKYWKEIRSRAGVSDNIDMTIAATDLSKENDWAKYSAGQLVDPTLYNIRRERRVELMSEGTRMRDLKRWRALDQVENYQVEGFNLWGGELETLYVDEAGNSLLIPEGTSDTQPNVSNKENSSYLRVNQIVKKNNLLYDGYTWIPANYLEPISAINFTLTSSNPDDLESSTIYQNPGWSKIANEPAIGY